MIKERFTKKLKGKGKYKDKYGQTRCAGHSDGSLVCSICAEDEIKKALMASRSRGIS